MNDLTREVNKRKTPIKKRKRGKSNMKLVGSGGGGVVEFRSPAEFPEDVFESAHVLNSILQHTLRGLDF